MSFSTRLVCLLSAITFVISVPAHAKTPSLPVLTLYNWSEYSDDALIATFEKENGIKINQVYYETDELKDEYLLSTNGGEGLDIIVGSEASFRNYLKRQWLAPVTSSSIPNLKHIAPRWSSSRISDYSVPYLWGTVGIVYRKDKIPDTISSWLDIYRPQPALKDKIVMIDDSKDTLGLALKALGYSLNSTQVNELAAAEKLLRKQKPYVKNYGYINLSEESSLIKGDVWMTMVYNGDGLTLQEMHPGIKFVVPQEGTNIWTDHIAVLNTSTQKDLALKFINFINEPKNAAQLAVSLNFATPNAGATEYLPTSFLNDPSIYPDKTIVEKSESYTDLKPREQKKRNEIYLRVVE